ncbi:MAG: ribonuclease P protein component [Chloroflexi bacterium]|nr:ribonuclease P protein component [Chloroflexota bacterium]
MRREQRLRRGADFERVRANQRRWAHPLLVCSLYDRRDGRGARVGVVVGRRVGKAVVRNRVKRRIREVARSLYPELQPGWDIVLAARPPAADAALAQIASALANLLRRAGVRRAYGDRAPERPVANVHDD